MAPKKGLDYMSKQLEDIGPCLQELGSMKTAI
jgi:hypothetical protein